MSSAGWEVLFPKEKCFYQGHNKNSSDLGDKTATRSFEGFFLMLLNQQAKNEVNLLAGMIGPDFQGHVGLLLSDEHREEYFCNLGVSMMLLSTSMCNRKCQWKMTTNKGSVYSTDPSVMKVCVTSPIKKTN